ncbi:hypothetical protein M3936_21755 [Sutcliffiella horikoshii]|uniref:hypothetical protein n=1 Tax=Sutcliffiella horikoshii TaxID=79883 RepID=UPI0007D08798|nr:hypothetical protein [Sutcliffiella horikoshii]MCM3620186.1 hypothetical protein [Sutcliffiella horikoshii]
MWLIVMGVMFLFFLIQGNIWGIITIILLTVVFLPGLSGTKVFRKLQETNDTTKEERYKQGDIYGFYTNPIALRQQKKERELLERQGRERI